jgi:7,8-dihydropterin-6-yl-methyl-4-(beta-D-ribofuranosyl)aminobenzene 5'-phosphate synthase
MRLTVLVEDSANPKRPKLIAKHGLSFFIELRAGKKTIHLLMDTGPKPDVILHNAKMLGVDLRKTDLIVLSHGHYDHTGGLLGVLKDAGKKMRIIAHPECFRTKLVVKKRLKRAGVPFRLSEVKEAGGISILTQKSSTIVPGVFVSGEIERTTEFEGVKGFKTVRKHRLVNDYMPDDQALFVMVKNKGLVVITGCAHAGLINTIKQAQRVTGSSGVYAAIGGFHLAGASAERIKATIDELRKAGIKTIMPCHCTGKKAITKFSETFGNKCRQLTTGDVVGF